MYEGDFQLFCQQLAVVCKQFRLLHILPGKIGQSSPEIYRLSAENPFPGL